MSGDAYHITSPSEDGDGAFRVMRNGHHATPASSPSRSITSTRTAPPPTSATRSRPLAIKRVFGEHAYKLAVSSTKSMTGHLLGGAGGLEAGITVLALRDQIAPPTINLDDPDPGVRSRLRAQSRPPHEDRLRAVELLRLRRHQRLPALQDDITRLTSVRAAILMKIVVSIKQVPARDSQLRIDAGGHWIQESDLSFEMNEPDAYALEEALQLKEKHGGEVVALCAGPARASQTIREALAKGADRAIHIEDDNLGAVRHARASRSCWPQPPKPEKPDLILTGLQSDDLGYGQTGVVLAELLGLPHATIIMAVEKIGRRHPREARARRRLVPERRDAAAGGADHPVRHQQAALRHADGHQEGEDEGDQAPHCGRAGRRGSAHRRPSSASTCRSAPSRRRSSTAPPREAAAKLVEKLRFEARVI